ncbi:hypothetical protein [Aeromicrobium massiliense]|uniref:hypothetical protein n=1 Tax=Aeromicrobium massiliense TaxID=1464554 RepID=UPI0002FDE910|nr:hypothetical protein [Aeromicrobium massiliense]
MHRGDWYEDPLVHELAAEGVSLTVTGSRTLIDDDARVEGTELYVRTKDERFVAAAVDLLERQAAPVGSYVEDLRTRQRTPFGRCAVIVARLHAAVPVDAVFDRADGNAVLMAVIEAMRDELAATRAGVVPSWHVLPETTDVVLHGADADALVAFVESEPWFAELTDEVELVRVTP